ncbi:hypothetical protein SNOG_14660 [Parastagonospora nodorum SN15]|uniref:Uncharacterized protein n=1 Tax=Phaeosphaeria nodorum (strain SN15 / ATCC MYA-4574 / FGSC 10173) TaxID=321614 RepID=Q0U0E8_PHANO|nr:hypothetical protein SNOG_14660 [Parastagonospora nodorum SN15]EAT77852.1 hypothetical protein SNOG_14660 [Parastagonospora nodorum SN15]
MTSLRRISYTGTDQNININSNILSHLVLPHLTLQPHASLSALLTLNLTQQHSSPKQIYTCVSLA